jgi:hypothetical protein
VNNINGNFSGTRIIVRQFRKGFNVMEEKLYVLMKKWKKTKEVLESEYVHSAGRANLICLTK